MPAKIVKVQKEHLPPLRFIGIRYTNADRNGGFAHKWGEWFETNRFAALERLGEPEGVENGYLGLMRWSDAGFESTFEYWIGMCLPAQTPVPDGFSYIDLEEGDVGVCWIKGKENEGLYAMHEACVEKLKENGMSAFKTDRENRVCFFERYNCPRFTGPDENGDVILDYGAYLGE